MGRGRDEEREGWGEGGMRRGRDGEREDGEREGWGEGEMGRKEDREGKQSWMEGWKKILKMTPHIKPP